jgi:hypothetical protein
MVQQNIETLQNLIRDEKGEIRKDLTTIIESTLAIWGALRKDNCTITVNCSPDVNSKGSWEGEESELPFVNGTDELPTVSAFLSKNEKSFAIFPQIVGDFELEDSRKKTRHTLHPGIALFADSPVFEKGLQEIEDLKDSAKQYRRIKSVFSPTTERRPTFPIKSPPRTPKSSKSPPQPSPKYPLQAAVSNGVVVA